jgi:hypothetical protein
LPGILYVSSHYKTAVHLCCCGCGSETVTPLTPAQWRVVFDGKTVSLHPSIGNWNLPCRSHYIIQKNTVIEAEKWSEKQIAYGQTRDKRARAAYYDRTILPLPDDAVTEQMTQPTKKPGWFSFIWYYLFSK